MGTSLLLLTVLSSSAWSAEPAASTVTVRGIVLVVVDTLRADRVGAASGGSGRGTPELDRFAGGAAVFTAARSPSSWSLPAALTLMTSMLPSRHGVLNRYRDFLAEPPVPARLKDERPDARTLAEVLRAAGWRTAAFTGGAGWAGESGLGAGFEVFDDSPTFSGFERTVPAALRWLDAVKPGERFFLLVHGYDVHPYYPGRLPAALLARHKTLRAAHIEGKPVEASAEEKRALTQSYDQAVAAMDRRLAPLLGRLSRREASDTAVVFTGDHGEELFDHGGVDHGMTLFEEVLRVPLLVRAPGLRPRRVAAAVGLIDLMPTLLDLAGVSGDAALGSQMEGVSLRPFLEGSPLELDTFAETDYLLSTALRAVATHDGWKGIWDRSARRTALYRLAEDPGERRDLSQQLTAEAAGLEQRLWNLSASSGPVKENPSAAWRRTLDSMRAQGALPLIDLSSTFDAFDLNPAPLAERLQELGVALIGVTCEEPDLDSALGPCASRAAAERSAVFIPLPTGDLPHYRLSRRAADPDLLWQELRAAASRGAPALGPMHFRIEPRGSRDSEPAPSSPPDADLVERVFTFCAQSKVVQQIVGEADDRFLPALEKLLAEHPEARVIWARASGSPVGAEAAARSAVLARGLLERHPNLYLDLSLRAVGRGAPEDLRDPYLAADGRLYPGWKRLIEQQPWRFLSALGIYPRTMAQLPGAVARQRDILGQLAPEARAIVAYKAAWRLLFDEDL
ncbi:MAG: sulfatase [Elusimicrobia bacterium]|nr:sulfatase [Elusimicrobiota bacterium]